jgi:hypothetical protein
MERARRMGREMDGRNRKPEKSVHDRWRRLDITLT